MALSALVVGGLLAPAAHPTTVEAKHTEPAAADPWNSRLSVDVGSDGRYSVGAFPDPSTGDPTTGSFKLLFGWPDTGTTYSTLRIDGADAILGQEAAVTAGPTDSGDTDTTTFADGTVTTTQTLSLVTNPQTGQADAVRIAYKVSNGDAVSHDIGVRAMLDTDVDDNDGAPYRVPGIGAVTTEQDLSGSAVPDTFQVFQDLSDTSHLASATLRGADATPPDRLVVAAWPSIYGTPWDYTTTAGQPITGDSAYATYWNPQALAPGSSRTYVTYYGLANVTVDLTPPIALGLTGPASLAVAGTNYSPNPFSVVATVSDDGTAPVDGATITLHLPAGLHTSDPATVSLGTLNPGDPEQLVTWHVTADPQATATTLTYSVTASGSNTGSKTLSRQIALPALASAGGRYVALGDSYSAGEGAIDSSGNAALDPATDTSTDKCHRSAHAYSHILKTVRSVSDSNFVFVACSGAQVADFVANVGGMGEWNERRQLDAIAAANQPNLTTSLVTLSVGGIDAGFVQVLQKCVSGLGSFAPESKCLSFAKTSVAKGIKLLSQGGYIVLKPKDGTWFFCDSSCAKWAPKLSPSSGYVAVTDPSLSGLYRAIHVRAPNAKIRVLEYPHLFAANPPARCVVGVFPARTGAIYEYSMTQKEMTTLNSLGDELNATISAQVAIAKQAGIDIEAVNPNSPVGPVPGFAGHGICDLQTPWINGLLWPSQAFLADFSPFSFHPNATGQAEFADLLQLKQ